MTFSEMILFLMCLREIQFIYLFSFFLKFFYYSPYPPLLLFAPSITLPLLTPKISMLAIQMMILEIHMVLVDKLTLNGYHQLFFAFFVRKL